MIHRKFIKEPGQFVLFFFPDQKLHRVIRSGSLNGPTCRFRPALPFNPVNTEVDGNTVNPSVGIGPSFERTPGFMNLKKNILGDIFSGMVVPDDAGRDTEHPGSVCLVKPLKLFNGSSLCRPRYGQVRVRFEDIALK